MDQKTKQLAEQAEIIFDFKGKISVFEYLEWDDIKKFAELIRSDERERLTSEMKSSLEKMLMEMYDKGVMDCQKAVEQTIEKAIQLEREACAKLCEGAKYKYDGGVSLGAGWCADAIRARK